MQKDKIIIFGAGNIGRMLIEETESETELYGDEIISVMDNDINKSGTYISDYLVSQPSKELLGKADWVVIASTYFEEIKSQLKEEYKIAEERITDVWKYKQRKWSVRQYKAISARNDLTGKRYLHKFNQDSTVVYTAILNGYDNLQEPLFVNKEMKYVCFTDNANLTSDVWEVRPIEIPTEMNHYMMIKKLKLFPHELFPEFDTSIWIDASFQITDDLAMYMQTYQKHSDFLLFPHQARDCIYDEGAVCMQKFKGQKEKIIAQMAKYLKEGYPCNHGLLWGGGLVRNHNEKEIIKLMEDWWAEIQNGSLRDQISLPYVLWKNNYTYDICDCSVYANKWIKYYGHNKELQL